MTLADTSVWIDHFRSHNTELAHLLELGEVLIHEFVIGELASGNLRDRELTLHRLERLPALKTARHSDVLHLIEAHRLQGTGLGWVDLHLLAAAKLSKCSLFTLDRDLQGAAKRLLSAAAS
jgi:predicted nucleic acid-binding protein